MVKGSCRTISILSLALMILCSGPIGCQKEEGALEKAGKKADSLLKKAGDAAKDAADKVKD